MVSIPTHSRTHISQVLSPKIYFGTSTDDISCVLRLKHFSHLVIGSSVSLDMITIPFPSRLIIPAVLCHRHRIVFFLLLLQGNVESNPGPCRYPCGECSAPVKSNQRGVQCEACYFWLHASCIGPTIDDYQNLQSSDEPWLCQRCYQEALPFFNISSTDSVFDISNASSHCVAPNTSNSGELGLNLLSLNCRSLFPKIDDLRLLALSDLPDIIAVCETFLDQSISSSELAIANFN